MVIRQGTTPTHTFTVPIITGDLKVVHIAYAQNSQVLFVKDTESVKMGANELSVTLTQDETLQIDPRRNVEIQVRVVTLDGTAMASDIITVPADRVLECEVL